MAIGLYGPEYLQFADGGPARKVEIFVFLPGTKTKAVLFSDRAGFYTAPNPMFTDDRGELAFFAEEGYYDLFYDDGNYTLGIQVTADLPPVGGGPGGFEYTVVVPAMLHQINHGLPWKPSPLSLDSLGDQIEHDRVAYPSPGIIEVIFGAAFGPGKIYLS